MSQKGQKAPSGGGAAALIGIMTILFIFYILFLPAEERKELLEIDEDAKLAELEGVVLNETPGRLSFTEKSVFDHDMPNIFLAESRNAVVIARENPFTVRKGWFGEQRKAMVFTIDELENTENVVLGFQAPVRHGTLVIALNGQGIFEAEVKVQNPPPITLPEQLLAASNRLEFAVTGGFFSKRKYELSDVKVVGDVTDVSKQEARASFQVSSVEISNLETSFMDFFPVCDQREIGKLTIELNGRAIYSAVPSCDSLNRQDIFAEDLKRGKNTVLFTLERGSMRLEQIRLRNVLEPVESFIDYFYIKSSVYNDILDRERDVVLRIEFVDDEAVKRAEININGRRDVIDQRDDVYQKNLRSIVKEGNNYVEIKPLTDLDIVKLEVRAE